jgi:hypothetical protein
VKDSENFGTRITKIGVAVAKIWRKEFRGFICNIWKVARGISGFIFENLRVSMEIYVPWVDIEQEQGPFCKVEWISGFRIYFPMENGVDLVDGSWTTGGAGPRWTADRASVVAHRSSA